MRIIGTTDNLNANVSKYASLNLQIYKHYLCTELSRFTNLDSEIDYWDLNNLIKIDVLNSYEKPAPQGKSQTYSLIVLNFGDGEKVALEVNSSERDTLSVIQSIRKENIDGTSYLKSKIKNELKNIILDLREDYITSSIFFGCFGVIAAACVIALLYYPIFYPYFWALSIFACFVIVIGIILKQKVDRNKLVRSGENSDFLNEENKNEI